jgi:UDP-glucose 4-epimerase
MKILVTGGAGFIGSHVVDCLVRKEHEVVVVDDLSSGKEEFVNEKAKFYKKDVTENLDDIFEVEKPEIVLHMAANIMLRHSMEDPIYDAKNNIIATINVLEVCRKFKVRKIIYTSTGGARVGNPEYMPVDEDHPINPTSPYGISKHTGEHYVWLYKELYGLDYLIFCFGNVYGPREDPRTKRLSALFIQKLLNDETPEIFGDGEQTRDFLYVLDLAEFIVESINKNPEHKLFHIANGKGTSVNKVFEILKNISGFKKNAKHIEAVKGEVKDIVLDTSLAQKELGWEPTRSVEEGLKATFEWFKK